MQDPESIPAGSAGAGPLPPAPVPPGTSSTYSVAPGERPRLVWPWVVTLVAGVAMAAAGIGLYVAMAVIPLLGHTGTPTPVAFRLQLSAGTFDVYVAPIGSASSARALGPSDVTVVHAGTGSRVPTYTPSSVFTISSNGDSYQGAVEFQITLAGPYRVHVASPGGSSVAVFVAPSLTSALTRGLGYLALVLVGGLVALLGLVLTIVRSVQRSRRRRPPARLGPRCPNGHAVGATDQYCPTCGAPVSAAAPIAGPA